MKLLSVLLSLGLILVLSFHSDGLLAAGGDATKGKNLYEQHCAACHGPQGKGDGYAKLKPPPADLTSYAVLKKPDSQLIRSIHEGRPNTAMGAWKWVLSDEETRDVLAYVLTLGQ